MKKIPLTQGKHTLVDDSDYEELSQYRWFAARAGRNWYAHRTLKKGNEIKTVRMHRLVIEAAVGQIVDHINQNGLDNRKENLRICSRTENARNRGATRTNKLGYKGVYQRPTGKYQAVIRLDGRAKSLGHFHSAREAALAFDRAALEHHGAYVSTNIL